MSIGEKLQACRKQQNLSQEALAEKLNVSRQTVGFWEKDQTFPTVENLLRLKELFGLSIDELLTLDESTDASTPSKETAEWTFDGFGKINRKRTVNALSSLWFVWLCLCAALILYRNFSMFLTGILTGVWLIYTVLSIRLSFIWLKSLSQNAGILHKCVLNNNALCVAIWNGERELSRRTLIPSDISAVKASHNIYLLFFRGGCTAVTREKAAQEPVISAFIHQINRKRDAVQ